MFVFLFQINVESSEKIDFSNIKKLPITRSIFTKNYENGKENLLYYSVYDVGKGVYFQA